MVFSCFLSFLKKNCKSWDTRCFKVSCYCLYQFSFKSSQVSIWFAAKWRDVMNKFYACKTHTHIKKRIKNGKHAYFKYAHFSEIYPHAYFPHAYFFKFQKKNAHFYKNKMIKKKTYVLGEEFFHKLPGVAMIPKSTGHVIDLWYKIRNAFGHIVIFRLVNRIIV